MVATPISTSRLNLELLVPAHADALFDGLCDERLYEFIDIQPPESIDALRSNYNRLETRMSPDGHETWLNWAVWIGSHNRYGGFVQATIEKDRSAEIAYLLFREFWGRGYGREAVAAMIGHLRDQYDVTTFRAHVDPRNRRSIQLLDSLGFLQRIRRVGEISIHDAMTDELEYEFEFD